MNPKEEIATSNKGVENGKPLFQNIDDKSYENNIVQVEENISRCCGKREFLQLLK